LSPSESRRVHADAAPLVSIVTPSLNQARFIEATIRSVQSQDYPNIEHVVVDGASVDGTLEILKRHPSLRWISEQDDGQADAINKGFSLTRGSIFAWLNADDVYFDGAVRQAVTALTARPEVAMVYANYVEIDEEGREIKRQKMAPFDLERQINSANVIPQPTVFVRRAAWELVGGLDTQYQYAFDYDLWIRLGKRFPLLHVDEYWAGFRIHPETKTSRHPREIWREDRLISRRHGGRRVSQLAIRHYSERSRVVGTLAGVVRALRERAGVRNEHGRPTWRA
jgi:glycosyltransferase involved in cell wall biosynthesis